MFKYLFNNGFFLGEDDRYGKIINKKDNVF